MFCGYRGRAGGYLEEDAYPYTTKGKKGQGCPVHKKSTPGHKDGGNVA